MSAEALLEDPDLFLEEPLEPHDGTPVGEGRAQVRRILRLCREFVDLAEEHPSTLEYTPTKPHLAKMLHRLAGEDQYICRKLEEQGTPLNIQQECKLFLMRSKFDDFAAIRGALDQIEDRYAAEALPVLGGPWYRRWRHLAPKAAPKKAARGRPGGPAPQRARATAE
mmetsp:Transcript_147955/g.473653  ORF Transcript_147955/g.473653 Transcript_147955/m.473653 type:complete len:167 (+) Transcript_147955:911-1411(+)